MRGLAVKMRVLKPTDSGECASCGCAKDKCVDMFEVAVGGVRFKVCDLCMEEVVQKSLRAVCHTNGRVKTQREIMIKNKRSQWRR